MAGGSKGHTGGCHCGAIRYRTAPHTGNAYICNCRFCQRMTGGPNLVEHCFTRDEFELVSGAPAVYVHRSDGSGMEVHVHFCADCGSHIYLTLERWAETLNVVTTTFDDPGEVGYGPETLRYLFLDSAQSGTVSPAGFQIFDGHCDPADGSPAEPRRLAEHTVTTAVDDGTGPHTGGCLCGDIRFEVRGDPSFIAICHCRSCQKTLGSEVNFELLVDPKTFQLTRGTPSRYRHPGGSGKMIEKRFCGRCSTPLFLTGERFPEVGVFRGALDRPNRITMTPENSLQIFLSEAMPTAMVLPGINAFPRHRRAPDNRINPGQVFTRCLRARDLPGDWTQLARGAE